MARMNRVMPSSTAGESSCCWVSACPGPLPAKWFMKPNSTVAPELDWVGLVTHTVVLPDSTAVRMSPIADVGLADEAELAASRCASRRRRSG